MWRKLPFRMRNNRVIPISLPPSFNLFDTIHAANERIPVESVQFGAKAMFEMMTRYEARQP